MTFNDFKQEAREYGVSNHFFNQMKYALIGAGDKVATLNPKLVTKNDMNFMKHHGYVLNIEIGEVKV